MAKKQEKITRQTISLENVHFRYSGVDYDYDTSRDCEAHGCDSICRCSIITSIRVRSVNASSLAEAIIRGLKIREDLDKYAIDRIVRSLKLYETNIWDVTKGPGYYGEEITGVDLPWDTKGELRQTIENYINAPNKIEFLLQLEYGYLLPVVTNKKWEIRSVPIGQVVAAQDDYRKKVSGDLYKEYDGVVAIVVPNGDKLRLIDGYHRYVSAVNNNKRKIQVIIGSD